VGATADSPEAAGARGARKGFRRDIQGLRALGLLIVFLAHSELDIGDGGFVGLDIFFVISGFLITGLIVAEVQRTGTLSLSAFYARRIRRLLPLAMTVLLAVIVGSWLLYPPAQGDRVAGDVVAAGLYFVNWRFASQAVDYFDVNPADSPVQHFWSLSVEEQFYLVWPLLIVLGVFWWRRGGGQALRGRLAVLVLATSLPSLLYTLVAIEGAGNGAYFSTLGRVWEFGLGAGLALVLPATLRLPRAAIVALAWSGLLAILYAAYAFEPAMLYPSAATLVPTLGTVALVIAGTATRMSLPIRLLSCGPAQYLGNLSYAWYLWHWPALVFARYAWGPLTGWESLAVIAASWAPAALTHHFIEQPMRHMPLLAARPRRALVFGAACMVGAIGLAGALTTAGPSLRVAPASAVVGAAAAERGEAPPSRVESVRPVPREAKDDRGQLYRDGCLVVDRDKLESPECVYGDRESDTTVVLFGDSHAMHYFPALRAVARREGWRMVALTRAGCPIADVRFARGCDTWRERSLQRIERERPDMVITSHTTAGYLGVVEDGVRLSREDSEPLYEEGHVRTLRRLRRTTGPLVVMRDLPRAPEDVADCVSRHARELERCSFPAQRSGAGDFEVRAARRVAGTRIIDLLPLLCRGGRCAAVIGKALVYRDDNHFTATFARTLAPWLSRQLPEPGQRGERRP
jgi:peptidoglycan/LPS O-acetylase OafA/YrhL